MSGAHDSVRTVDDLDYELPDDLIAQEPAADRAGSRLLHYARRDRSIRHRMFRELPDVLRPGDVLVMNDSRVTPARFTLVKPTGGIVEGLFVEELGPGRWRVMLKNLGPRREGLTLAFENEPASSLVIERADDQGSFEVAVRSTTTVAHALLERLGRMPLPPYIRRAKAHDGRDDADRQRYQTVYATEAGSIAAPTAGLHFTPEVFARLDAAGVIRATVTLHVGLGTFKPIEATNLDDHLMHAERFTLGETTCEIVNRAKREKRRVIAVGTTTTRVLESQPAGDLLPAAGQTRLFIRPPYAWKHVDALVTNFHQPRSTLIALVAAMTGLSEQRRAYAEAVRERYRFLSYGDSMFIDT